MREALLSSLGKSIQTLRRQNGLSQERLAQRAGVPYTTLTKIETGVIHKPSVFAIYKIAKALGTSVEALIE